MANIVVTTSGNSIIVDFGVYASDLQFSKSSFQKASLNQVGLESDRVVVTMMDGGTWPLVVSSTTGCFIVDTVDGVAPASLSDLFDKITALR